MPDRPQHSAPDASTSAAADEDQDPGPRLALPRRAARGPAAIQPGDEPCVAGFPRSLVCYCYACCCA